MGYGTVHQADSRICCASELRGISPKSAGSNAVERGLEILGEAARRVSEPFRQTHSEIDWRHTIGLRNVIAHRYEQVQQDRIWAIVTVDLNLLLAQLEPLLPEEI